VRLPQRVRSKSRTAKKDPETRAMWKRLQFGSSLLEREQKAVIRLINSLGSVGEAGKVRAWVNPSDHLARSGDT
jgi:hypothetical protein